jgi:catechol 2,3-dioxygenase-like lactoylglutathione lyase family enzyme
MTHITGFFHGGITVKDMEASLKFYRDGLQLEVEFDVINSADYLRTVVAMPFSEIRIVYLRIPNSGFVELLEYRGVERHSASARPADFGGGHLCLYVDDIEAISVRMQKLGYSSRSDKPVDIVAGPNIGAKVIYMIDPDGYFIELFQKPIQS